MVAKADIVDWGVVHDVHYAICLVQAGEQARGDKVSRQDTDAIQCPANQYNSGLVLSTVLCFDSPTSCLTPELWSEK